MTRTDKQYPRVPSDTCYVYVLSNGAGRYTIGMAGATHSLESRAQAASDQPTRLVFYRRFDDTLSALGYKRLLEVLDAASVEYIIMRSNPGLDTLEFQQATSGL